jgi:hypothetical protein
MLSRLTSRAIRVRDEVPQGAHWRYETKRDLLDENRAYSLQSIALGERQSTAVFRIVEEALMTKEENGILALRVDDNGHGKRSLGLLGMRERVQLISGPEDIVGLPALQGRVPLAAEAV